MKGPVVLCLLFVAATAAHGQCPVGEGIPDTLDWRRYYPLEIGNAWEYHGIDGEPHFEARAIVADTVANGRHYFVRRDSIPLWGNRPDIINTFYLRYDTAGTVVVVPDLAADTLELPSHSYSSSGVTLDALVMGFDLRAPLCPPPPHEWYAQFPGEFPDYMTGGYDESVQVGAQSFEVDARKCIYHAYVDACYAADIGFLGGGSLARSFLTYARVGGREYGESLIVTNEHDRSAPVDWLTNVAVYPNPARGLVTLHFALHRPGTVQIGVYDALGRLVHSASSSTPGRQTFPVQMDRYARGVYFVHLRSDTGRQMVRAFVMER